MQTQETPEQREHRQLRNKTKKLRQQVASQPKPYSLPVTTKRPRVGVRKRLRDLRDPGKASLQLMGFNLESERLQNARQTAAASLPAMIPAADVPTPQPTAIARVKRAGVVELWPAGGVEPNTKTGRWR